MPGGSGPAGSLRLIAIERVCQKDAGTEQSEKGYDCVNHGNGSFPLS